MFLDVSNSARQFLDVSDPAGVFLDVSKALSSLQQIFICPSENSPFDEKRKKYMHIHTRFFICCSENREVQFAEIYIHMYVPCREVERWAGVLQPNFSLVRYFLFSFVSV